MADHDLLVECGGGDRDIGPGLKQRMRRRGAYEHVEDYRTARPGTGLFVTKA